jgi:CheY-like chemotaxis protein
MESFRLSPGDFDLVITDMAMPDMSGVKLSRAIKNIREDIPIILCTGFSEDINSEADLPDQLDALLMKPVESPQLFGKIRELLDIAN